MNEEKAIKLLKEITEKCDNCKFATCEQCEISLTEVQAIKWVLNDYEDLKKHFEIVDHECFRLEKEDIRKDMIINKMAEWINGNDDTFGYGTLKNINTEDKVKQYFEELINNE